MSPSTPAGPRQTRWDCRLRMILLLGLGLCLGGVPNPAFGQDDDVPDPIPVQPVDPDAPAGELPLEEEEFSLEDEDFAPEDDFVGAAPQMVGDFFAPSSFFTLGGFFTSDAVHAPLPIAGGSSRIKIAENNQVTPMNRAYATYNHFHNAFVLSERSGMGAAAGPFTDFRSVSVDQYTIGFEKAFCCGLYSVELRMPFTNSPSMNFASTVSAGNALNISTGSIGNLTLNLKALLYKRCDLAIAAGCGIATPTGSDVTVISPEPLNMVTHNLTVRNDAVHFLPWLGIYSRPRQNLWWQGFAQLDVAANGNRVVGRTIDLAVPPIPDTPINGVINDQTVMYLDLQIGYWLYQACDPCATGLTGLAGLFEVHYSTALTHADGFLLFGGGAVGNPPNPAGGGARSPGFVDKFDVVNLTVGCRAELNRVWLINAGMAVPVSGGRFAAGGRKSDRFFDFEAILQVNRQF